MSTKENPYAILKIHDYRCFLIGRFAGGFGNQMLTFAVAWELWVRTHSTFSLGMIGLCLVLPIILLALPAGHVADNHERRRIVMFAQSAVVVSDLLMAVLALFQGPVILVYGCLIITGSARAFNEPSASTLLSSVVPVEHFSRAATWNSSVFQTASILGPATAGVIVAFTHSAVPVFALAALCALTYFIAVGLIRGRQENLARKAISIDSLVQGIQFLRTKPVLLASITLDLFAVLFGGAVALMPVFATDVLHVGAPGLGVMRAAPAVGALLMALLIAHRPPFRHAGLTLLVCVIGFGAVTVVFGLSTWFPLSVAMLVLLGAFDNVSVVIRSTLMLTQVPDDMRGRTSAVNTVFIASSNELGDFESGVVAGLIGPVLAVITGGLGTLAVVGIVIKKWPQLKQLKTL